MKAIQTALIGYGFSGSVFHAPFLKSMEEFEAAVVCSSNPKKVKKDLPDAKVTNDFQVILQNPNIELVVITTPNNLHFKMAEQALQAGKHVIVEKPMVLYAKEAEKLVKLSKQNNVMLSVYQNRRWDGDFLTVKKLKDDGVLGEIHTYEAHFDRFVPVIPGGWREENAPGAGMLYDLGSHLIDQALFLFGMPDSVTADLEKQRQGAQVDDYFHLILKYGTKRVILHSEMLAFEQGPKYKVHGSKGTFIKYGEDLQETELIEGKQPTSLDAGMDRIALYGTLYSETGEEKIVTVPGSYIHYYEGVYQCIRYNKDCPVTAEDGLNTIRIIEAALESSQEKRTVVL